MKKIAKKAISILLILTCIISFASCGIKPYSRKRNNDAVAAAQGIKYERIETECSAESYTMDLTLDTKENTISGKTNVIVENKSSEALTSVCFRYFAPDLGEGSKINSAKNVKSDKKYDIIVEKDKTFITVDLKGDSIKAGKSLEIELDFTSVIPEADDRYGYSKHDKGRIYNFTFCFPQLAIFDNGEWFDEPYFADGETTYNEMSDYYVTLKAPKDYVVLGSGNQETENGITTIEAENVREMAIVACNFATIETTEVDGVTFNLLRPDYGYKNKKLINDMYDLTRVIAIESIAIYSEKVGEYIYDELDIIPMALEGFGGMEMPGFIQVGLPANDDTLEEDTQFFNDALSDLMHSTCHEVGHQWFYCAVGNDQYNEAWLDESFTSYLEGYYARNAKDYIEQATKIQRDYLGHTFKGYTYEMENDYEEAKGLEYYINFPSPEYKKNDYSYVYVLGENFFRELETTMGEEKFFEMLSAWYSENTNEVVDGYAFIQHLLEYDSSDKVKTIINNYISEEYLR